MVRLDETQDGEKSDVASREDTMSAGRDDWTRWPIKHESLLACNAHLGREASASPQIQKKKRGQRLKPLAS